MSSVYIFKFFFFLLLLCTTTIVNGVYRDNRSSSMFLWRIDGWFIKGQVHKIKPLSLTSVVWRYFGVRGWWDNDGMGWGSDAICSSLNSLTAASSVDIDLELNKWAWAVVAILEPAATLYHHTCRIPSDRPNHRGSRRLTMRLIWIWAQSTVKLGKRYYIDVEMLLRAYLNSPVGRHNEYWRHFHFEYDKCVFFFFFPLSTNCLSSAKCS